MNNEKEPSVSRLRVVFGALKFLKSGTEMSDRDSKILVELREVFENHDHPSNESTEKIGLLLLMK